MSKRYDEPIEVEGMEADGLLGLGPVAFSWRGRRYAVGRLLKAKNVVVG